MVTLTVSTRGRERLFAEMETEQVTVFIDKWSVNPHSNEVVALYDGEGMIAYTRYRDIETVSYMVDE
jgi:hypothetical protein